MATAPTQTNPGSRRARRLAAEASAPTSRHSRKRARPLWQKLAAAAAMLALLAGSFALGWHFGVDSTRYKGGILLVNEDNLLSSDYVPEGLVNLYEQRHSFRLARSDIYVTRETYEAMEAMFAAAEADGVNGFIVTSGYRDYDRQAEVYAESEEGYAQPPGASEHQTGLCFDVTTETNEGFESTEQYAWLREHAHEYGFIQRYPANKADITGISYEPWHYRYVGVSAATQIRNQDITLEEYVGAAGSAG